jgi:Carboxypeptidase regulatory-like domain/TonB dependent receptor
MKWRQAGPILSLLWIARILLVVPIVLPLVYSRAYAQTTSGTIVGTITDPSGAVIPTARVTVTNIDTNISRTVQTGSAGDFEVPDLIPGHYKVFVEAQGFRSFLRTDLSLDARATVRVDAKLEIRPPNAPDVTVQVNEQAPVITTESATVSEAAEKQSILDLPLNYRAVDTSPLTTITTIPGVQVDPNFGVSVSGNHPAQNEVSVDGFSVVDIRYNVPLHENFPSTEALAEVKVTEQLGNAEFGQVGDVAFISRGGSNEFHGSLFEYLQNNGFDARPEFAFGKPPKHANDFGGSIGGPVLLPHYNGHNKTFFYFDWETNLYHTSDVITQSVPTNDMRSGNFAALCGGSFNSSGICTNPQGIQLMNPFNGQPYRNNQLTGLNPVSQKILSTFYPQPNFSPGGGALFPNYQVIAAAPIDTNLFDIRIDQKIASNQTLWGRFSWKNDKITNPLGLLQGNESIGTSPRSVGINYTYVITPTLLNEFRFGYSQETDSFVFNQFPSGESLVSSLGLKLPGPFPPGSAIPGFFFNQSGVTGTANNRQEDRIQHRYQFNDNLTWVHGRHEMKFGTDIRHLNLQDFVQFIGADDFGVFNFSGQFTGYDVADFLLGLPAQSTIAVTGPPFNAYENVFAVYAQDQFQLTPKLTLNYGLRYEVHPPFFDRTLQMSNFDPANGDVVVPNAKSLALAAPGFLQAINACPGYPGLTTPCTHVVTAAEDHKPEHLRNTDWGKVLPRFNFAYRLTEKTVVRAGFGMYDETLTGLTFYSLVGIHTANVQGFSNSITAGVPLIQFPNTVAGGIGSVPPPGTEDFRTATQFNLRDPYGMQWSATVERELGANTGLRITYTGLKSVGLLVNPDLNSVPVNTTGYNPANKPFPNFRIIYQTANGGEAFYNGLETVLTHRFSKGLLLQSSYVFAKNLSDAEGSGANLNGGFAQENGPFIADRYNYHYDYGDVSYTRRNRWQTTYVYQFPLGKGQRFGNDLPAVLEALIGNWQTSGILLLQSGPYLTPFYFPTPATDPSGTGLFFKDPGGRPDRVCNGNISHPTAAQYFDPSCFVIPATGLGRFGDAGVGILKGPGTVVWSAGLAKVFPVKERLKFRLEATANNIANHANLGIPNMNVENSTFGQIFSVQNVEGAGARTLQLGLRMDF